MQIMTFITIYAVLSQMTFLSKNTLFSRHFWVCYQAPITFNDVCLPVLVLSVAAIAALIRKTLGFGQLQPGEAQASFSLLHQWIGEFLSLTPLDALAADI